MTDKILNQTQCVFCGEGYKAGEHHSCEKTVHREEKVFIGETKTYNEDLKKEFEEKFMRGLELDDPIRLIYFPTIRVDISGVWSWLESKLPEAKRSGIEEAIETIKEHKRYMDEYVFEFVIEKLQQKLKAG